MSKVIEYLNKCRTIILLCLNIIIYFVDVIFLYFHERNLMNSDLAAEVMLSDLLNSEHKIITSSWYYSTELRVFCTQLIYKVCLAIFPTDWRNARVLAVSIFLIIFALSMIFMMNALGYKKYSLFVSFCCLCPISALYAWDTVWCSHYILFVSYSAVTLGILVKLADNLKAKNQIILLVVLGLFSLLCGLNGIRQFMICYAPLILTTFFIYILDVGNIRFKRLFFASIYVILIASIGLIINEKVFPLFYNFKTYSETNWQAYSIEALVNCFDEFIKMFGWLDGKPLGSISGIANGLSLILAFFITFLIFYFVSKYMYLSENDKFISLYIFTSFIIDEIAYALLNKEKHVYWGFFIPFALIVPIIFIKNLRKATYKIIVGGWILVTMVFSSISTMQNPYYMNDSRGIQPAVEWLEYMGYTQGCADFWNSDVITGLTNGDIKMWTVTEYETLSRYEWLQTVDHVNALPEGEFFIILDGAEYDNDAIPTDKFEDYLVYGAGYYYIYSFSSVDEYLHIYNS